jgi:hypothetical protein
VVVDKVKCANVITGWLVKPTTTSVRAAERTREIYTEIVIRTIKYSAYTADRSILFSAAAINYKDVLTNREFLGPAAGSAVI